MRIRIAVGALCALGAAFALGVNGTPVSASQSSCDFVTGGGYIYFTGANATFAAAGGCKNGSGLGVPPAPYWGHLEYQDHAGLVVHGTSITAYVIDAILFPDPKARLICGTATTSSGNVNFVVRTKDAGEPVNDEFDIQLTGAVVYSTFPSGPHKLGGGTGGGGNILLHKPNQSNSGMFGGVCPALGPGSQQAADVSVTKTAALDTVGVGGEATYNITVMAGGTGSSTNVTLIDILPTRPVDSPWTLSGPDASNCMISSDILTCTFGTMASGTTKTIAVSTTVVASDCLTGFDNTATVRADNDTNLTNNSSGPPTHITVPCSE